MLEYMKEWEEYLANTYKPANMTREDLRELYEIADIMKDMSEYWTNKQHMLSNNMGTM